MARTPLLLIALVAEQTLSLRLHMHAGGPNMAAWGTPCPTDENTLAAEMAALSFFQYQTKVAMFPGGPKETADFLKFVYPVAANCWTIRSRTGSSNEVSKFHGMKPRPGFQRLVNEARCLIADVYEGTRTPEQLEQKKKTPEAVPKQGFWLKRFSEAIAEGADNDTTAEEVNVKREFVKKWCGDPLVQPLPGMAMFDHLTHKYMDMIDAQAPEADGYTLDMKAPDKYTLNGKCPNGVKYTIAGHSMGQQLAFITAYCANYHAYKLWSRATTKWPDWAKGAQFYSSIYGFAGRSASSGSLIDFGSLVPSAANPNQNFKGLPFSFAWDGLRTVLGGDVIHDPNPDAFCAQPYDPIGFLQLTDKCGEKKVVPAFCPVGANFSIGASPETILSSYTQKPCTKYQVYSLQCPTCSDVLKDHRIVLHGDHSTYISYTQAAMGMACGIATCPVVHFLATQEVNKKNAEVTLSAEGDCGGKFAGGQATPGPAEKVLLQPTPLQIK